MAYDLHNAEPLFSMHKFVKIVSQYHAHKQICNTLELQSRILMWKV